MCSGYERFRAPRWKRILGDIRWYARVFISAFIELLPELFTGACFGAIFVCIPVFAAFLNLG